MVLILTGATECILYYVDKVMKHLILMNKALKLLLKFLSMKSKYTAWNFLQVKIAYSHRIRF